MREHSATTTINASPDTIWAILTNGPGYPQWDPGVDRIEGRIALGEKITAFSKVSPGRAFPVKVTEFEPGRKMVWSSGMPLGLFKGERTFTLAPQGSGATQFTLREVFTGPLLSVIGRSIPDLTPMFEQFAAGLKSQAESAG